MRTGVGVFGDSTLVHFIRLPVDEALVVIADQDRPLGARQMAGAFPYTAGLIHVGLLVCFTISIGACIDRIGQDLVDGGIGGSDPLDLGEELECRGKERSSERNQSQT